MRIWANQLLYTLAIVYYWILQYFIGNEDQVVKFSFVYFLFVLPAIGFIALNIRQIVLRNYSKSATILLLYTIGVSLVSTLRGDFASIYSTLLFSGTVIAILNSKCTVTINFLNTLFLSSIVLSVITTHLGINEFGYLPGVWEGRVSLFPLIPESAFFCCIIIVANYFLNESPWRFVIYGLALYFLIFSGSKTAFVTLILFFLYSITLHFLPFRIRGLYSIYNVIVAILFIIIINLGSVVQLLKKLDNKIINQLVFRSEQVDDDVAFLQTSSSRLWIWEEHLKIFSKNPLIGVGSFNLSDYATVNPLIQYTSSTGSESFFTSRLARFGLITFGLLLFIFILQQKAINEGDKLSYFLILFLLITMLVYGSFIVPYNFLFLIVIGLFNNLGGKLSPEHG